MFKKIAIWATSVYASLGGIIPLPLPMKITVPPVVFLVSEDAYAVLWETSRKGTGWLAVTVDGEVHTFYDVSSGSLRGEDRLHVVRVPKDILDGCEGYQAGSRRVLWNFGYFAFMGRRAVSKSYAFRGYEGQDEIRALFFTDQHGEQKKAIANAEVLQEDGRADLVILAGDIPKDGLFRRKSFTRGVLGLAGKLSGGETPVLYARGNHETRGKWAAQLRHYLPTDTGELYFTARYGPVHFTLLDSGEDKRDGHHEYYGMAAFAGYRAKQLEWLGGLDAGGDYAYRVCVSHADNLDREGMYDNWYAPLRERLGVTHLFCGHGHNNRAWENGGVAHYMDGGPGTGSLLVFTGGEVHARSATGTDIREFGRLPQTF